MQPRHSCSPDPSGKPFQLRGKSQLRRAISVAGLLALGVGSAVSTARAQEVSPALYMAVPITTGSDTRFRAGGFAKAFREVMVKLTGEPRLDDDIRIKLMAVHAANLVASFGYVDKMVAFFHHDDQGTYDRPFDLTVHFDPGKIDATIAELGESKWTDVRPTVVPVIVVRGTAKSYLLTRTISDGVAMRGSFARAGIKFGMPVRIPRALELTDWGVAQDRPLPAVVSSQTEARVYGTMEFKSNAPIGWTVNWRMHWDGTDYSWKVEGVSYDAAFDSMVAGVARVASGHGAPD